MLTINNNNNYAHPNFGMAMKRPVEASKDAFLTAITKKTNGELTPQVKRGLAKTIEKMRNNPNNIDFLADGSVCVTDKDTQRHEIFQEIAPSKPTVKNKWDKFLDKCTELVNPIKALPEHYQKAMAYADELLAAQTKKIKQLKQIDAIFDKEDKMVKATETHYTSAVND